MDAINRHLASHHGVMSRGEAIARGMTTTTIRTMVRSRRWKRIGPGVYRVVGAPVTWLGRARALALSTNGLISHRAAARVWGLDGWERARLEVTVSRTSSRSRFADVRWHRSTQMHLADRMELQGVPVTGLARTVLDLAGVVSADEVELAIDAALRTGRTNLGALEATLAAHSRRGRTGCGALRAAIDDRKGEDRVPDSRWNRLAAQRLVASGLPEPTLEYEVRDPRRAFVARVDLAWPASRLAVELDSVRFHLNQTSFVEDRRRVNRLVALGWRVLAFTWDDWVRTPERLVDAVRAELRRSA